MGKRHRRIRARSATGPVAGAATEKPGLEAHRPRTGLPNLRSPRKPPSRSTDRRSKPGRQPPSDSFKPRQAEASRPPRARLLSARSGATAAHISCHGAELGQRRVAGELVDPARKGARRTLRSTLGFSSTKCRKAVLVSASSGGLLSRSRVEPATDRGGELGQVAVALDAPEALLGFGEAGGGPPQAWCSRR